LKSSYLLARDEADLLEDSEMLLSPQQIVDDEVRLTDVLVASPPRVPTGQSPV